MNYTLYENKATLSLDPHKPTPEWEVLASVLLSLVSQGITGGKVMPLLTDLHTHGCIGYDFSTATAQQMQEMQQYYLQNGIGQVMPTLVAIAQEAYPKQLAALVQNMTPDSPYRGIHLEGPFLNPLKKGAIAQQHLCPMDMELVKKLWEWSEGYLRIMTVAPELEHFDQLCAFAEGKFTLSFGHTHADYKTARVAFAASPKSRVTHLFNAMDSLHHRTPTLLGAALERNCQKEVICDGIHLQDSLLRMLFQRFGEELLMVSDCISATGLPEACYKLGDLDVTVHGERATLSDGTIAGSCRNLLQQLCHCLQVAVDPVVAIDSATRLPALSLDSPCTPLKQAQDFLVLDTDHALFAVYRGGKQISCSTLS